MHANSTFRNSWVTVPCTVSYQAPGIPQNESMTQPAPTPPHTATPVSGWSPSEWLLMSGGLIVASTMLGGTAHPAALIASAVLAGASGTCAVVALIVGARRRKTAKRATAATPDAASGDDTPQGEQSPQRAQSTMGSLRTLTAILLVVLAGIGVVRSAASVVFWPEYERFHACVENALSDVTRAECQSTLQRDLQRRVEEVAGQ